MPYYDIELHKEKYMYTVQADSEEQAKEFAIEQANWDYTTPYAHVTELSMPEVSTRHASKHWQKANTH
jgi:hypothetical protein